MQIRRNGGIRLVNLTGSIVISGESALVIMIDLIKTRLFMLKVGYSSQENYNQTKI